MKQSDLGRNGASNSRQRKLAITFLRGAPIILLLKNAEARRRNTRLARSPADSLSNASHWNLVLQLTLTCLSTHPT